MRARAYTGRHPASYNRTCGSMWANCGPAHQRSARRKSAPEPKPDRDLTQTEIKQRLGDRPGIVFTKLLRYVINPQFSTRRLTIADVQTATQRLFPRWTPDAAKRTLHARFSDVINMFMSLGNRNQQQAARDAQDFLNVAVAQLSDNSGLT